MKQGSNYAFTAGKTDKERDAKRLASCRIVLFFLCLFHIFRGFVFVSLCVWVSLGATELWTLSVSVQSAPSMLEALEALEAPAFGALGVLRVGLVQLTALQCRRSFNNLPRHGPILRTNRVSTYLQYIFIMIIMIYIIYLFSIFSSKRGQKVCNIGLHRSELFCSVQLANRSSEYFRPRHKCQPTVNAAISKSICARSRSIQITPNISRLQIAALRFLLCLPRLLLHLDKLAYCPPFLCFLVWESEFMCTRHLFGANHICFCTAWVIVRTCKYIYNYIYILCLCVYLFPGSEESHSHTKPPPAHLRAYQRFLCRHPSLPAPAASSWPWEMKAIKVGGEKLLWKVW